VAKVHHSAIVTRDIESSLAFWRDGLGFGIVMDETFEGPWPDLFGTASSKLRSVFLGEGDEPESGILELVELLDHAGHGAATAAVPPPVPDQGFFLVSLHADLDDVLPRLAALGVGSEPVVRAVGPVRLAVVHDPNGVKVELMDTPARANLASMSTGATER
jgi:catechol 2,3-dioxygenase-like lactoylglutathione lyase family enzyme